MIGSYSMEKSRFSLLLLEPGEVYFQDYRSNLKNKSEENSGWLKLCSKSLVFEPECIREPVIKILLQYCEKIEVDDGLLVVHSSQYVELLAGNVIAPYKFHHEKRSFSFHIYFIRVDDCLQSILQLHRASSLQPPEQNAMIAAITYSRQCRQKFDLHLLGEIFPEIVLEIEASKVSPLVVNPGRIVLSSSTLYFQPFNNADSYPIVKINLAHITHLTKRRFLLRHIGVELFCESVAAKHLYLVFKSEDDRQRFYDALVSQSSLRLSSQQQEIMTLKWQNRVISNFEYLMYLNSTADRSVNDLTQYPVFPWVICDYTSSQLDLNNVNVYRDLTKPIGAINPERLKRLKKRRDEMETNRFLYGSHYSTPAFVLFYLIRKCPQYMLCLQNGRFDHPDRIFHNISDVWRNVTENMADFKELIPEFYDTSAGGDFLLNSPRLQLGKRHNGHRVHDVELPPWCNGAQDFVQRLREALESEYVSEHLPKWIDLVFGCKQRGEAAEAADNVFYHLCYEGAVDLDSVVDLTERHALEVQIMEFGQIPKQIFQVPHPSRLKPDLLTRVPSPAISGLQNRKSDILATHRETVTCVASFGDVAVSVGRDAVLKEFSFSSKQLIRSVNLSKAGISACVMLPNQRTVALGTFDNVILIYDLERSKVVDELHAHEDAVCTLCWSEVSRILVSASWDGSLLVWHCADNGRLKSTPIERFYRDSGIMCAALDKAGDLIACATKEAELTVFRIMTTKAVFQLRTEVGQINALSFYENRLVVGSDCAGCQVYDIFTGLLVYSTCNELVITSFAWMQDVLLIGSDAGELQSWFLQQGKLLDRRRSQNGDAVSSVNVSSCGQFILTGEGNRVVLYSI